MHAIRAISRLRLLGTTHRTRKDAEGIDHVDVEAASFKAWKDVVKSLSPPQRTDLNTWRGGAVKTQTRLDLKEGCMFCGAERPSARHLWAECVHFSAKRQQLIVATGVTEAWWSAQQAVGSQWQLTMTQPVAPSCRLLHANLASRSLLSSMTDWGDPPACAAPLTQVSWLLLHHLSGSCSKGSGGP